MPIRRLLLIAGALALVFAVTLLAGLRQGLLTLLGLGFGAVLQGCRFGFTTGWREYLERRQALYAPEVGKVEDIRGLGDALSWAGTQVGQGAASMADPAALGAAGTALGKLPGAFKLAPLAAGIGAFALNQRQMAGEHVGRLREDPTAMANLGAKGVYDQANLVGAAGGALDTLFPFAVGRAFGGAALRQGVQALAEAMRTALDELSLSVTQTHHTIARLNQMAGRFQVSQSAA